MAARPTAIAVIMTRGHFLPRLPFLSHLDLLLTYQVYLQQQATKPWRGEAR